MVFDAIANYTFMQNALLSSLLASIACGVIGTLIMEKRLLMMAGGVSHSAFGGIGLGYYLGIEPIYGALVFALGAALGISTISRKANTHAETLIALFWSMGMALGVLFITLTPGYPPDMASYLFGNILTVSRGELRLIAALTCFILLAIGALFQLYKAYLLDEEHTKLRGIPVAMLEYFLYALTAVAVVILIRVVGIILVLALLSAPPSIARMIFHNLKMIMIAASLLGAVFNVVGLWISYELNIPSGAAIIVVSGVSYFVVFAVKAVSASRQLDRGRIPVAEGKIK